MLLKNNNYQVKWFSSFEPKTSIESTEEFYIKHVWERNCVYHISLLALHHIKYCIKDLRRSYHVETCLILFHLAFVVVQSLSHVWLCVTPWAAVCQASLPFTISQNLFKLMSTEWVLLPNHPSHPLSHPSLPALNLSQHQGLFQWLGCLHQVIKLLEH